MFLVRVSNKTGSGTLALVLAELDTPADEPGDGYAIADKTFQVSTHDEWRIHTALPAKHYRFESSGTLQANIKIYAVFSD